MNKTAPGAPRSSRYAKFRPWLIGLAVVVALAATIVVVSAITAPKRSIMDADGAVTNSELGTSLLKQAQQAERSGDTSQAIALAKSAVAADGSNQAARKLIDRLEGRDAPSADPSPGTPSKPSPGAGEDPPPAAADPDAGFDKPVADLTKLLPTAVEGFRPGMNVADAKNAVAPFDPKTESPVVKSVLYSVHDQGDASGARAFVDRVVKVAFPGSAPHDVTVPGLSRPAYYGTDGRVATIGFYRGRFAFEVSVTGGSADTAGLRAIAVTLASQIPTTAP